MGKSKISPTSDEYVLDQLSVCEEKLLKVLEDLDSTGKDLGDIGKQMAEEEVGYASAAPKSRWGHGTSASLWRVGCDL